MLIVVHQLLGQPLTVSFALANELVSFQSLHTQRQSCRRRRFRVAQNSRCRFCWADRCSSGRDPLFSHLERGKGRSSSVSSTPVRRTVALPTSLHSTAVSASFFETFFRNFLKKKFVERRPICLIFLLFFRRVKPSRCPEKYKIADYVPALRVRPTVKLRITIRTVTGQCHLHI